MSSDQVVREVVAQLLDLDEDALSMDQPLADIAEWDSVNALRVLVYLERELGEPVDYDRFMRAELLADLAALVEDVRAAAG
ncbi:acyl carrier protein [Kitasatospora sp. NPDC048365]|uniref:Carrier domain-containing protein n=1 Tax=Kitasatospora terrestris TaxID=258051 RepID=A0ABP9DSB5_9ACTN